MINVKLSDLIKMVEELKKEKIKYVEIMFSEQSTYENHIFPSHLNFGGYDGEGGITDFGKIDNFEVDAFYNFKSEAKRSGQN